MNHTPTFQIDAKHKSKSYVKEKLARSLFYRIERNVEPLNLMPSDICDFKSIQSRTGNIYYLYR